MEDTILFQVIIFKGWQKAGHKIGNFWVQTDRAEGYQLNQTILRHRFFKLSIGCSILWSWKSRECQWILLASDGKQSLTTFFWLIEMDLFWELISVQLVLFFRIHSTAPFDRNSLSVIIHSTGLFFENPFKQPPLMNPFSWSSFENPLNWSR